MGGLRQTGRIAFRHEGQWWNAYYALPHTMDGAIHLGSVKMTLVENKEVKDAFIKFMELAAGKMMKAVLGVEPEWPNAPHPAPEHERSGNS